MSCNFPRPAWKTAQGDVVFVERGDIVSSLELACGRCRACRKAKAREWMQRNLHEQRYQKSLGFLTYFVTFTYEDLNLPEHGSLSKDHALRFTRAVRRAFKRRGYKVKIFFAGEYGEKGRRPHYHALIYGVKLDDLKVSRRGRNPLYESALLSRLWPHGFVSVGIADDGAAEYCSQYALKKVGGKLADVHYAVVDQETGEIVAQREREFLLCSNGLGVQQFFKFLDDFKDGMVTHPGGGKTPVCRAYIRALDRVDADLASEMREARCQAVLKGDASEKSDERRAVREAVLVAADKFWSKRKL